MTLAPSPNNILLGKGELFLDRFDSSGNRTGFVHLGNCTQFQVTPSDTTMTLRASQLHGAGIRSRITRSRDLVITAVLSEYAVAALAMMMMGTAGTFSQATGTITETVSASVVQSGHYVKLANRSVTITKIVQGSNTWSATDYTLTNSATGLFFIVESPSSKVTASAAAVVTYTRAAVSVDQIAVANKTLVEGRLIFSSDPTTGPQWDAEYWHVSIIPTGNVGFIGSDFEEFTLNMAVLDDYTGTYGGSSSEPYGRLILRGTA